ncbi:MAG: hypothetical protein ACYC3I_20550 [Gemmataceae bacterium]
MAEKFIVKLTAEERQTRNQLTTTGKAAAATLRHASLLLKADEAADEGAWSENAYRSARYFQKDSSWLTSSFRRPRSGSVHTRGSCLPSLAGTPPLSMAFRAAPTDATTKIPSPSRYR